MKLTVAWNASALITGNPAAAALSLGASFLLAAAAAAIVVAMRFPRARTWLAGRVTAALWLSKRVTKRPGEPRSVVTGALDRVGALRLGYRTTAGAFGWALVAGGNDSSRSARQASSGADVDRPDKIRVVSLVLIGAHSPASLMTAPSTRVTPMSCDEAARRLSRP